MAENPVILAKIENAGTPKASIAPRFLIAVKLMGLFSEEGLVMKGL